MILCDGDGDGDEKILILSITHGNGKGMEIAFAGTDGDGHRVQWGRLGTDLNFTGTDGDGDKCSSLCRALVRTRRSSRRYSRHLANGKETCATDTRSCIVHNDMNRANVILITFHSQDRTPLTKAFNTYVRPLPVWSPLSNIILSVKVKCRLRSVLVTPHCLWLLHVATLVLL